MGQRYNLIVFDWDGTLLDSTEAIVTSLQDAARDMGICAPDIDTARYVIGLGLDEALRYALPELDVSQYDQLIERYRHHYLGRDTDPQLFSGIKELLEDLSVSGFMLAIATGKSRAGLERTLRSCNLEHLFQAVRCADQCKSKPHPQMLLELMAEFREKPGTTLMVGDTVHDLNMATAAGVDALAVSYGAHPRELLVSLDPVYCAGASIDMAAWLRNNA